MKEAPSSKSTKSDSGSTHRLSRLLKGRHTEFRGSDDTDLKYYWAAYKLGGLDSLGPVFKAHNMERADFESSLVEVIGPRDWVVTFIADTKEGRIPVGSLSAMNPLGTRLVSIADIVWFPWASHRNCVESMVNFVNELRDEYTIMEYADEREPETKRFFENLCRYSVMRRVGTVHDLYGPGNSAALYQSRRRKN